MGWEKGGGWGGEGGIIFLIWNIRLIVNYYFRFFNNYGGVAGAVFMRVFSSAYFENCLFVNNSASENGGNHLAPPSSSFLSLTLTLSPHSLAFYHSTASINKYEGGEEGRRGEEEGGEGRWRGREGGSIDCPPSYWTKNQMFCSFITIACLSSRSIPLLALSCHLSLLLSPSSLKPYIFPLALTSNFRCFYFVYVPYWRFSCHKPHC